MEVRLAPTWALSAPSKMRRRWHSAAASRDAADVATGAPGPVGVVARGRPRA